MRVKIVGPQSITGELRAPRSKAYTHRALVASLLSKGESVVDNPLKCDDTNRTLRAIESLGARISKGPNGTSIAGNYPRPGSREPIDCGESGATLRFLTAVSATMPTRTVLKATGGLANRPLAPLVKSLRELGATIGVELSNGDLYATIQGPLEGGSTIIEGDISSQFISGLLFAAPLAHQETTIEVKGVLESKPYVDLTLKVLEKHGIRFSNRNGKFTTAPQEYRPASHVVPADFSSTAFLLAAGATVGEDVVITGLDGSSDEPDSLIIGLLNEIGADVRDNVSTVIAKKSDINGFEVDARDHPDLVPVLEVLACHAKDTSQIRGVGRLQFKESNRLETVPLELAKMGAEISVEDGIVTVEGGRKLSGSQMLSHNDHRVAMACATASLSAQGLSTINDAQVVAKSYPDFFADLTKLGARVNVE